MPTIPQVEEEPEEVIAVSERSTKKFKEVFEEKTETLLYEYIPLEEGKSFDYELEYAVLENGEVMFFDVSSFSAVSTENPLSLELEKVGVTKGTVKIIIRDMEGKLVYEIEKEFGS